MDKDRLYLGHIREAIDKISRYTRGVAFDDFKSNELILDAVVRELEIIGEASRHLSEAIKEKHPDIPWQRIGGMRNKLIHEYFGVDVEVIWKTITEDLQELNRELPEGE